MADPNVLLTARGLACLMDYAVQVSSRNKNARV